MNYDFTSLSPIDFEHLVRDLLQSEMGIRLENFAAGSDHGIDLRYSRSSEDLIVQVKHYSRSSFSTLILAAKAERDKIAALKPTKYIFVTSIFVTSQDLTPGRKAKIQLALAPYCADASDILGRDDLNNLLGRHPSVERRNINLWLSSTAVLQRVLHAGVAIRTEDSITRYQRRVQHFVPNSSLDDAQALLEKEHVLILSGAPGVGKTTLAEVLAHIYAAQGWELIVIDDLVQAYEVTDDSQRQLFLFDDFLGQIALTPEGLRRAESRTVSFMERVNHSANARFILTTREYILQQARMISERLSDPRLDISRFFIDVANYTRRIKALTLFNHLYFSKLDKQFIEKLA